MWRTRQLAPYCDDPVGPADRFTVREDLQDPDFEIDAFTPIINPPESAILGVGRIVSKPVGLEGQIVLRDMMALSLSFDHRVIDDTPAAKFLQRLRQLIERPFFA